jgi:hypothetical protein
MKYPVRNIIYEKVKQAGNITDTDLMGALEKEDNPVSWPDFNKILLDLEIYGLISTKYCLTLKYIV